MAPEPELARRFVRIPELEYISGDLDDAHAMVKMDITDIQYPDHSFDVIFCSHVLEHVPDDRKALREFYRILRPRGWAMIPVPLISDKTFEDFSATDPAERERVFGHPTHVRKCGPDYKERMEQAGFKVTCFVPGDVLTEKKRPTDKSDRPDSILVRENSMRNFIEILLFRRSITPQHLFCRSPGQAIRGQRRES